MHTTEFNPLVSIIIPVYNGSNYVAEAIESALAQTYKNIEILVVNDGSKDEGATEKIALEYGDKIRYFYKENGGVSSALNLGIEKMQGEYFSWLSHDDKYAPEKIQRQVEILEKTQNKEAVVLCSVAFIDKDSKLIEGKSEKVQFKEAVEVDSCLVFEKLFASGSFNGCALLIHKNILNTVGEFEESLRYVQDLLMWAKIFLKGYSLIAVDQALVLSRIHEGQLTQTGRDLFYKECIDMGNIIIPEILSSEKAPRLLAAFAKYNAKYNNFQVTKRCLKEGADKKILSCFEKIKIRCLTAYGKIRPLIRKIYYKLLLKVKTQ